MYLIIINKSSFFTLKFRLLLCYFLGIEQKLYTRFHFHTNKPTKKLNSIIKIFFEVFINCKYNNSIMFLPIVKFVYNNTKITSIDYTLFNLNFGYNPQISFEKNVNPCSYKEIADKRVINLKKLLIVCHKYFYHAQKLQK